MAVGKSPGGAFAEFPVVAVPERRRDRLGRAGHGSNLQEYLKCAFYSRLHSGRQPWRWRAGAITRNPRSSRHNRRRFLPRTHRSSRLGRRNIDVHLLNRATGGACINSDIAHALLRWRMGTFWVHLFAASPAPRVLGRMFHRTRRRLRTVSADRHAHNGSSAQSQDDRGHR
jgi:hypothetical protein